MGPQDLTGKSAGWYSFTLANLGNIPVGAGAYAGLKWSVPCDPFIRTSNNLYNEFTFYSFDSGPSIKPYLSITYNEPGVQHVITSSPAGRSLTVDSSPCTAPCTFQWTPGTQHTIATTTPQSGGTGIQYVFASWSDGGAISHSITASSSPATYTANFTTQYLLTTAVNPPAGGTITPPSGWYNAGAVVTVSAGTNPGYQFSAFTGDLSGTTNPQNLTMNGPKSVWANFTTSNQPPQAVSVTPSSGSGSSQTFTFTYADPNGYQDLKYLTQSINTSLQAANGCYFFHARAENAFYLMNDAVTQWLGPITPGTGQTVENSQCRLSAAGMSVWAPDGATLKFAVPVTFKPNYAGAMVIYQYAEDMGGLVSNWVQTGTWTVPPTVTVTTNPPGLQIIVDLVPLTAPQTFQWTPGSNHTIAVATYQGSGGTRYIFSNWSDGGSARHTVTAPSSNTTYTANFTYTVTSATMQGPTWLQVGLSYMPFDVYDHAHLGSSYGFANSCPSGSSVRGCFQTVLRELRAQGVSGVRIFFEFCGGAYSTPLSGCGQHCSSVTGPNAAWVANVREFFRDVSDADIANITITPVHHSQVPPLYTKLKDQTEKPGPAHCYDTPEPPDLVYFDTASPFGRKRVVIGSDVYYYPVGEQDNTNARNCAPKNPYFIGWQNQYNVINAMLYEADHTPATPSWQRFTVFELDFEQEMNLAVFPVLSRFIYDNAQQDSGQPAVLDALRYYMSLNNFDPARAAFAAPWPTSSKAGANCLNVYQDYARLMGQDQIASAIGGGVFGWPHNPIVNEDTGGLICYGTPDYMASMQYYGSQPIIMDVHLRPEVKPPHPVYGSLVRSEAQMDFDDIIHYLDLPFVPSSTMVVLGETWSSTTPTPCEGGPANAAADTVAGYNDSNLDAAGRQILFRPWMQLQAPSGNCFSYPNNQRVNFGRGGPYAPGQF